MKWSRTVLLETKRRVRAAGSSVGALCRRAEIDRSSWHLWEHNGVTPRPSNWEKIERALRQIEAEHHAARAA
jgi:hypothetical protein